MEAGESLIPAERYETLGKAQQDEGTQQTLESIYLQQQVESKGAGEEKPDATSRSISIQGQRQCDHGAGQRSPIPLRDKQSPELGRWQSLVPGRCG